MMRRQCVRSSRPGLGSSQREVLFPSPARRRFRRLALERLEDRTLLAISHSFAPSSGLLVIQSDTVGSMFVSYNDQGHVTVNQVALIEGGQPLAAAGVRSLVVDGSAGPDLINVSLARRWFSQLDTAVRVYGNEGDDILWVADTREQEAFVVELHGGSGNDHLRAGRGRNRLYGWSGDDLLVVDANSLVTAELVDGGDGNDALHAYSAYYQEVFDDRWWVIGAGNAFADVSFANIERRRFEITRGGDIDARQSTQSLWLVAGSRESTHLYGGSGDDFLFGNRGYDLLHGGGGDDYLEGGSGEDQLFGGLGDDRLVGGPGRDRLDGGCGSDIIEGGAHWDWYLFSDSPGCGAEERDEIVEEPTGDRNGLDFAGIQQHWFENYAVAVDLTNTIIATQPERRTVVTDTPEVFTRVYGSPFNDRIFGNEQDNLLLGRGGNDAIFGRDGNDELFGEDGDDILHGGVGNDVLRGGPGNDQLFGGANDDGLRGEEGADLFVPGGGNDTTDGVADVATRVEGPAQVRLRWLNTPVPVGYTVFVSNHGEDYANNVNVQADCWAAVVGELDSWAPGSLVRDPETGELTDVRFLAPSSVASESFIAQAIHPGLGVCHSQGWLGTAYITDPELINNEGAMLTLVYPWHAPEPVPPRTEVKTVRWGGGQTGNGGVYGVSRSGVSSAGDTVVFTSNATDYDSTPNVSATRHVYYGDPRLVDVDPLFQNSGDTSGDSPSVSADGRYVAFASAASNLLPEIPDDNHASDVFVRDVQTGVTRLVSVNHAGNAAADGESSRPQISGDGRFVVFVSQATDLVAGFSADPAVSQVYRANLETGAVEPVSVNASDGGAGNGNSQLPLVNHDGRYVVWGSAATDLVGGVSDANRGNDLFVRDMTAGTTAMVTVNHQGTAAANGSFVSRDVDVTPDGAFISFASDATDLVDIADPVAFSTDIFVYDVAQGTNRLASISSDGTAAGNSGSSSPVISADGRYVAFESSARNLVAGNWSSSVRVYVRDLNLGVTEFGAVAADGVSPADFAQSPSLSGDGRFLAFTSGDDDLVDGFVDGNGTGDDVYVRDRENGTTTLISVNADGTASGNGGSLMPLLSGDGQVVYYLSEATDLVPDILDENGALDLLSSNRHVAVPETALRYSGLKYGPSQITLRRNGADLELVRDADGVVLASRPLDGTTVVEVEGAVFGGDRLTVDFAAGGFFSVPGGVRFLNSDPGWGFTPATLALRGSVTTMRYDATGVTTGYVTAETDSGVLPIEYQGVETIVDESQAENLDFFSWMSTNSSAWLTEDDDPNNGRMTLSVIGTEITFNNPSQSLSMNGGSGDDDFWVNTLDPGFAASLLFWGGDGDDEFVLYDDLGLPVTLDGGLGNNTLVGRTGDTTYIVTPGGRNSLYDEGGNDTLSLAGAAGPVTVDLDLEADWQEIDEFGNQLRLPWELENFIGTPYGDVVWIGGLHAMPQNVHGGVGFPGETAFDELRVRTNDPAAVNTGTEILVPGYPPVTTGGTFARVSMGMPPVAVDDQVSAQIDTAVTIPVAANDSDPENNPFAVSAVAPPIYGTAVLNGDGTVTYTPAAGFFGFDRFRYTIQDPLGGDSTATVYVTVNQPPDAVDDAVTNTIVTVDVLDNDTDPDGDTLSVTEITQPADGTAVLNADGTITYTPPVGFDGTALIPYTIGDGFGGTDSATLTVTVRPVNDPPAFAMAAEHTVDFNAGPQSVPGWATDISPGPADEAGQSIEFFTLTDNPELFAAAPSIAPDGTLTYTPAADAGGTAVVLVQAVDDGGTADGGRDESWIEAFTITVLKPLDIELLEFGTAAGSPGELSLTYEIHGAAAAEFEIAFFTSGDARHDGGDAESGPRINVTDPAFLAVGTHTVTVSGAAYEAGLLDPAVPFFLALVDAGQAVPDETDETNNDLNFMGLYHRPASPAPLLIRGGDDTDRRADDPNDMVELTGGAAVSVTSRFTASPLAVPWADVASIRLVMAGGQDTIQADAAAIALLHAEGGTGTDTLVFLGGGIECDLTAEVTPRVRGVELLDIGGSGANRLVLRQAHVLESDGDVLDVRAGSDDAVDFGTGWTLTAPQFVGGEFFNVLTQAGATLRLTGPHPWQNPVDAYDVDNSGEAVALDVLLAINLINSQTSGLLPVPPSALNCPPHWYDVSGDDLLTALDVLMVINWINGQPAAAMAAGGEGEGLPTHEGRSPAVTKSPVADAASGRLSSDAMTVLWTPADRSTSPARTRKLEVRDAESSAAEWHEIGDRVWGEWLEEFGEEL